MKLTPKQRREIYLKAAKKLGSLIGSPCARIYLCGILADELNSDTLYTTGLPEFDLFEPTLKEKAEEETVEYELWWHDTPHEYAVTVRIICMLLCAEMTKP